jgi:hypothetical protein
LAGCRILGKSLNDACKHFSHPINISKWKNSLGQGETDVHRFIGSFKPTLKSRLKLRAIGLSTPYSDAKNLTTLLLSHQSIANCRRHHLADIFVAKERKQVFKAISNTGNVGLVTLGIEW